jgi:RND family efflux transporter MFP subunit
VSSSLRRNAALAPLLLLSCDHHAGSDELKLPEPTVRVETAQVRRLEPTIPVAGVLSPLPGRDVKVGALVMGRVDQVFVAEGDPVKAGQPLAHVEAGPLKDRLTEAEAHVDEAKATLANAKARLARTEKLFAHGIASKQELDDATAAKVAAESALKQALAGGATAGLQLDRATLRSPIAGVVAAIIVPAGQPVDGNGTPVIEVADTRTLDLRAPIPSARAPEVSLGERATLSIEGAGTVTGTVAAIAPLVDPATNTVMARIRVPNASGRLRGGMFAKGALILPAREAVAVPRSALLPGDGTMSRIAVLTRTGTIAHRELVLGAESGDRIEVREGLQPSERVVIQGGYSLPEGTHVEVAE